MHQFSAESVFVLMHFIFVKVRSICNIWVNSFHTTFSIYQKLKLSVVFFPLMKRKLNLKATDPPHSTDNVTEKKNEKNRLINGGHVALPHKVFGYYFEISLELSFELSQISLGISLLCFLSISTRVFVENAPSIK